MKRFKHKTLMIAVVAMGVAGNACNSSSSTSETSQPQKTGPAWSLDYRAACAAETDPTECVGAYGFTVNADGTFQVGPTPQGQVFHGKLDAEDFASLTHDAAGVLDGTAVRDAEACNGYFGDVADYTLKLEKHGQSAEVMHKTGDNLCSSKLDAEAAENLHNEILSLADKYYPTPFPDACLDAAQAVEALYPAVQKCSADSDCGYLTPDFAPIGADTISTVVVDNCSVVATLPAANLAALHDAQAKLQAALQHAQQVCGTRIARNDCTGPAGFASSAAPAVCEQGVCRVNPSLGY